MKDEKETEEEEMGEGEGGSGGSRRRGKRRVQIGRAGRDEDCLISVTLFSSSVTMPVVE